MLFVEVKKGNIEKALKDLKGKVIRTKQNNLLFARKEFVKDSVVKRSQIQKAAYIQKKKSNQEL
jgi:small subunit ribosomal protein S21